MEEWSDISVEELHRRLDETERELRERMDAYDERAAMQSVDDGISTDRRAIEALQRTERFRGEHAVAMAWLKSSKTARIWSRRGNHA